MGTVVRYDMREPDVVDARSDVQPLDLDVQANEPEPGEPKSQQSANEQSYHQRPDADPP